MSLHHILRHRIAIDVHGRADAISFCCTPTGDSGASGGEQQIRSCVTVDNRITGIGYT